jgi:hypothetical protein
VAEREHISAAELIKKLLSDYAAVPSDNLLADMIDTNIIIGMYHKTTEVKELLRDRRVVIGQCA